MQCCFLFLFLKVWGSFGNTPTSFTDMEETFDEGSGNKETAKEPSSPETAKDKDTGSIDDVTADGGENEANIRSAPPYL